MMEERNYAWKGLLVEPQADVFNNDLTKLIEEVKVPTVTTDTLLSKHQIENFDLLCIDTEGYDFEYKSNIRCR